MAFKAVDGTLAPQVARGFESHLAKPDTKCHCGWCRPLKIFGAPPRFVFETDGAVGFARKSKAWVAISERFACGGGEFRQLPFGVKPANVSDGNRCGRV